MPRIPLFDGFGLSPTLFLFAVGAVPILAIFNKRWSWAIVSVLFAVVFATDQLTMQPWAYQFMIYSAIVALAGRHELRLIRVVAISVYLFSGLGKLDFQFAHTVGTDFLSTLTLGATDSIPKQVSASLALLLPATETIAGSLLIFRRTRRTAASVVMGIHLALILVLGPWALDHSTGVLAWNFILIGQAYYLFWRYQEVDNYHESTRTLPLAFGLMMVVVIGPLGERSGYWDHWLAWALYAPHTSRIDCELSSAAIARNPNLKSFCGDHFDHDRWHSFNLAKMSLRLRGVPIYPQSRYQLKLMAELMRRYDLDDGVRIVIRGVANRWTGQRSESFLVGRKQVESYIKDSI